MKINSRKGIVQTRKHYFLAMFPEGTKKHCFPVKFPEGEQFNQETSFSKDERKLLILQKNRIFETNNYIQQAISDQILPSFPDRTSTAGQSV